MSSSGSNGSNSSSSKSHSALLTGPSGLYQKSGAASMKLHSYPKEAEDLVSPLRTPGQAFRTDSSFMNDLGGPGELAGPREHWNNPECDVWEPSGSLSYGGAHEGAHELDWRPHEGGAHGGPHEFQDWRPHEGGAHEFEDWRPHEGGAHEFEDWRPHEGGDHRGAHEIEDWNVRGRRSERQPPTYEHQTHRRQYLSPPLEHPSSHSCLGLPPGDKPRRQLSSPVLGSMSQSVSPSACQPVSLSQSKVASANRPNQNSTVLVTDSGIAALRHLDATTAFLYNPRTVTILILGVLAIAYFANVFGQRLEVGEGVTADERQQENIKAGIWAGIAVFLGYSTIHGPKSAMVRPHPAVWRLVHGLLVMYVMFLVFLVFQDVEDARLFLKHLSPSLGVEVQYRSYASDCQLWSSVNGINWTSLRSTLWDEFVVAHLIGWWAKALAVRNYTVLWLISIGFEACEFTFRHMLPNFNECWWDSWLLDVALCNFIGIMLGMATVRVLDCKYARYNWQGISQLSTFSAKVRRASAQFLPYSWDQFHWAAFSSPLRFLQCMYVVFIFLAFEVNVFFLKYALWIPPTNPLNTYRLVIWFLCALPAVRDWYEFIEGRSKELGVFNKLGPFAWIATAITAIEMCISIKFGRGLYPNPWPPLICTAWIITCTCVGLFLCVWQILQLRAAHHSFSFQLRAAASRQLPEPATGRGPKISTILE